MNSYYYYNGFNTSIIEYDNLNYKVVLDGKLKFTGNFGHNKLCRAVTLGYDVEKFKEAILDREISKYLDNLFNKIKNRRVFKSEIQIKIMVYHYLIESREFKISFKYYGLDIMIESDGGSFSIYVNGEFKYNRCYLVDFRGIDGFDGASIEAIMAELEDVLRHYDVPLSNRDNKTIIIDSLCKFEDL